MNLVVLMGHLTKDPEFKNIGSTNVANFSLALNRIKRDGQKETVFVEVSAFGKTSENIAKYFTKGKKILIQGRLHLDSWTDKNTNQQRTKLKVVAERFEFVGGNQQTQSPQPAAPPYNPTPAPAAPTAPASPFYEEKSNNK